jgi:hypothetical protein
MANVKLVGIRKIYEERGRPHVAVRDLDPLDAKLRVQMRREIARPAGPVELTARIPAPAPAVGARFRLRLPPDKVHLFDAVSTLRIES